MADAMLQLPCPGCGKRLKGPTSAAGRTIKCPSCGTDVVVPKVANPEAAQRNAARPSDQVHIAAHSPITLESAPESEEPDVPMDDRIKLIIKRDQRAHTGLFGGHKGMIFTLSYRVVLTPQAQELVKKYKAEEYPLTFRTDRDGKQVVDQTVSSLMRGRTEECKDITVLLNNEEVLKRACQDFKTLLTVMASFGGKEVIEF